MWALFLVMVSSLVSASSAPPAVMACTFDFEAPHPLEAIGHVFLNSSASRFLVDVPNYNTYADQVEGSRRAAWEYVSVTAENGGYYIRVFDLLKGNTTQATAVDLTSLGEVHCSTATCYGLDINNQRLVEIDPISGSVATAVTYSSAFVGNTEDASALDRKNLVFYATLFDQSGKNVFVAMDIRTKVVSVISNNFTLNNTGPFCFDDTVDQLYSLGSPLGGIVSWSSATSKTVVLRKDGIGGIPGERTFDCAGGIMAFQYVDFTKNYLVALDTETGKVFHNSTLIALHGMYLTQ